MSEHRTNDLRDLARALAHDTGWSDNDIGLLVWAAAEIERLRAALEESKEDPRGREI